MRLIIDIDKETYKKVTLNNPSFGDVFPLYYAIKNGTPIPNNATVLSVTEWADKCRECGKSYIKIPDNAKNGDVMKAVFNCKTSNEDSNYLVKYSLDGIYEEVNSEWWNAPYQKGVRNERL